MRQKTISIYKFEELDDFAQETAIMSWRESQHDSAIILEIEEMEDGEVAERIKKEGQEFLSGGLIFFDMGGQ